MNLDPDLHEPLLNYPVDVVGVGGSESCTSTSRSRSPVVNPRSHSGPAAHLFGYPACPRTTSG